MCSRLGSEYVSLLRALYGVGGLWSIALVVAGIWQLVQPRGIALRPDRLRYQPRQGSKHPELVLVTSH